VASVRWNFGDRHGGRVLYTTFANPNAVAMVRTPVALNGDPTTRVVVAPTPSAHSGTVTALTKPPVAAFHLKNKKSRPTVWSGIFGRSSVFGSGRGTAS